MVEPSSSYDQKPYEWIISESNMSNQYHTQCPKCQAIYPIPASKLNDHNARAKCGRCQQVFLLHSYRLSNTNAPVEPVMNAATVSTSHTHLASQVATPAKQSLQASSDATDNPMIFDDMGGQETKPAAKVRFLDEELDEFLNQDIKANERQNPHNKEDESWLQDLLAEPKDTAQAKPSNQVDSTKTNEIDLVSIIPAADDVHELPRKNKSFAKVFSNKPTTQQLATKKPLGVQLMWLIGCLILLVLLGAQYAIFNLDKLVKNPQYAPIVQKFCTLAKCSIPNADLSNLTIDAKIKNHKQATDVIITIHNKSGHEQLYPDLLVRLKNKEGMVVADFVAGSYSYLSESQKSILGNQSKKIMLTAKTDKMPAIVEVTPFYQKNF